jgi:hypothetical protein
MFNLMIDFQLLWYAVSTQGFGFLHPEECQKSIGSSHGQPPFFYVQSKFIRLAISGRVGNIGF